MPTAVNNGIEANSEYAQANITSIEDFMVETAPTARDLQRISQFHERTMGYGRDHGPQTVETAMPWMESSRNNYPENLDAFSSTGETHPFLQSEPAENSANSDPSHSWAEPGYSNNLIEEDFERYLEDLTHTGEFLDSSRRVYQREKSPLKDTSTTIHSLDQIDGQSAQYFGLSGESDPYLLRHFRWDENGERPFVRVHFRRVGPEAKATSVDSEPFNDIPDGTMTPEIRDFEKKGVPIHFALAKDELAKEARLETAVLMDLPSEAAREELNRLIHPEDGRRMVAL